MKVVMVVDSIVDLENKISKMKSYFGKDIRFLVKNDLVDIFKTYHHAVDAIYTEKCSTVLHLLLSNLKLDDTLIYFTSLDIDDGLLTKFTQAIGDRTNVVVLNPKYNVFERLYNSLYNIYVKRLFDTIDTLYCKKLQFLPKDKVEKLLETHFANRLFDSYNDSSKEISTKDKEINKNWKKTKFNTKPLLINLIIALSITLLLVVSLTVLKINYVLIFIFVLVYMLNIVLSLIYAFKLRFDNRYLR